MPAITTAELTTATTNGNGVFDVLMRSMKTHLDDEFKRGSIKGPEYATVYLGSLNLAMQTGLSFLLQQQKTGLEIEILEKQLLLAGIGVQKSEIELAMLTASQAKIPAEIAQLEAQTLLIGQQRTNMIAEGLNIPKQGSLLDAQVIVAEKQVDIADAEIAIKQAQVLVAQAEVGIAEAKLVNLPKEGAVLDAQALNLGAEKLLTDSKVLNLAAETLNVPKQGALLDAQVLVAEKQVDIADAEIDIKQQQILVAVAEVAIAEAKLVNIPKEGAQLDAQTLLIGQQKVNLEAEALGIAAKTDLTTEQTESEAFRNFVHPTDPTLSGTLEKERQVLIAQECKLKAEFDLTTATTSKVSGEIALLAQKTVTESAQVLAMGVDDNSVIGKQKLLYGAQTDGFKRDAEQKAAKLLVDTWNVRRTTDESTIAGEVGPGVDNGLGELNIGRAITKLLTGVGA
jgi:hypothetical protein